MNGIVRKRILGATSNQKGIGLIEVMIGVALSGFLALTVASLFANANRNVSDLNTRILALDLKVKMTQTLLDPVAWAFTKDPLNNASFACLSNPITCTTLDNPISLFERTGNPMRGWDRNGVDCPATSPFDGAVGNDKCPFGVIATWSPDCGAAAVPCAAPAIKVTAKVALKTATSMLISTPLNPQRYSITQLMSATGAAVATLDPSQLAALCNAFGGSWDASSQRCNRLVSNGRCPAGTFVTGIDPVTSNVECATTTGTTTASTGVGCTGDGCVTNDGGPCYGNACVTNGTYCNGAACRATGSGAHCDGAACVAAP